MPKYIPYLATFVGFLASAIIGFYVNDYLSSAAVRVSIVSMGAGSEGFLQKTHATPVEIDVLYENASIKYNEFEDPISLTSVEAVIQDNKEYGDSFRAAVVAIENTKAILQNRPDDYDASRLRGELSRVFFNTRGNILEGIVKSALFDSGFMQNVMESQSTGNVYEKYLNHPEKFSETSTARISVDSRSYFDLSELSVPLGAQSVEAREIIVTNMFRRLFIYLDREIFISVLEESERQAGAAIQDIEKFGEEMLKFRDSIDPQRLHARILVENEGGQSATVSGDAAIAAIINDDHITVPAYIVVAGDDKKSPSVLIAGHSSLMIDVFSERPLREIRTKSGADLSAIIDAQVVDGIVGVLEQSGEKRSYRMPSGVFKFGASTDKENYENAERSIRAFLSSRGK